MWPQNIMFFLFPAVVIILVFLFLPFMNRKKEPFGYKTSETIDENKFIEIKNVYLRKLFLFSVPFSLAIAISNIYILSTFLGSFLLITMILSLAGINFLFYMQGYQAVKEEISKSLKTVAETDDNVSDDSIESNELPKW